jgi:hypothetical protein
MMTFTEKIPTFSIHGESASPRDVERLASELMECRAALISIGKGIEKYARDTVWIDGWNGAGDGVHITASDVISELTKTH